MLLAHEVSPFAFHYEFGAIEYQMGTAAAGEFAAEKSSATRGFVPAQRRGEVI
jgi:hypothetical protein